MNPEQHEKYSRQILFAGIGEAGQEKLLQASAVLVGCGALGTVVANLLVRAGLERLRIIDRDFVEPSNLQRQTLFDESDAREALPKAVAAERHLRAINSGVKVEGIVADLTPANAAELLSGFPLILDGTDNFETRLLVNDAAVSLGIPWIYAAAVGSYGVTMTILPGETACLACLLEGNAGTDGESRAAMVARWAPKPPATRSACWALLRASSLRSKQLRPSSFSREGQKHCMGAWCPAMSGRGNFNPSASLAIPSAALAREVTSRFLKATPSRTLRCAAAIRCRFTSAAGGSISPSSAAGWRSAGRRAPNVRSNDFLLRFRIPPYELTVFADGRAIVKGTQDPAVARSLYARYISA